VSDIREMEPNTRLTDRAKFLIARHPSLFGMPLLLIVFLAATVAIHPNFNSFDAQSVAMAALPLAFAAAAQSVVVISGGIDLSIGSVMAVCNVLAASTMGIALARRVDRLRGGGDRRGQWISGCDIARSRRHRNTHYRFHLGRRRAARP
jgi:ribose/xylose/arabinose/galactoside ABC-type transport system permease subunit